MPGIRLIMEGDGCWPDLQELGEAGLVKESVDCGPTMALLEGGMESGRSAVLIRIDCKDGCVVICETSLAILDQAVRALVVRDEVNRGASPRPGPAKIEVVAHPQPIRGLTCPECNSSAVWGQTSHDFATGRTELVYDCRVCRHTWTPQMRGKKIE